MPPLKPQLALLLEMIGISPQQFCDLFYLRQNILYDQNHREIIRWIPADPIDQSVIEEQYAHCSPLPLEIINDARILIMGIMNDFFFPPNVGKHLDFKPFTSLSELHLQKTYLSGFPAWVQQLSSLSSLSLYIHQKRNHAAPTIPIWFSQMHQLTHFSLQGVNLEPIDSYLFTHPTITSLKLTYCQLSEVQWPDVQNPVLRNLHLEGNELTTFPDIHLFPNLERLTLSKNNITEIPIGLIAHPNLKIVNLSENQIHSLPSFEGTPTIDNLYVNDNPITNWSDTFRQSSRAYFSIFKTSLPEEWQRYSSLEMDYEYYRQWSPARIIDALNHNQEIQPVDILHPDFLKYQTYIEDRVLDRHSLVFQKMQEFIAEYYTLYREEEPDKASSDDFSILL